MNWDLLFFGGLVGIGLAAAADRRPWLALIAGAWAGFRLALLIQGVTP